MRRCLLWACLGLALAVSPVAAAPAPGLGTAMQERLTKGVGSPRGERDGQDLVLLGKFYESRNMAPVWLEGGKPGPRAAAMLAALKASALEGLEPKDYGVNRIAALLERGDSPDALAELELLLTKGALTLGRDLASGRLEPSIVDPELFVERRGVDPLALLGKVTGAADPGAVLATLLPTRIEYVRLRDALARYRDLAAAGGWPRVQSEGETLKPGQADPRVPSIRERLKVTGEYPGDAPLPEDPTLYDPELEKAVVTFQRRHGLDPDGAVGKGTFAALNVPVDQRIGQIKLNMERWRWMPDDLGRRYLIVNLAAFELALFEEGKVVHQTRVVVGATSTRTPVFSETMTFFEVNPYWHVPVKIARDEIFPKAKKDPTYLAREGYVLLSDYTESAVPVDPKTVDWAQLTPRTFRYRVRQEPGDKNSLGRIKMMFPNQWDIYLHDTPSKKLFGRATRSFSHGCIRVENPFDLAEAILRVTGTTSWDRVKLDEALASGQRQVIRLKQSLPVHITYITAFVESDGTVDFRGDVYGRDRRLAQALIASRVNWPDLAAEAATNPAAKDAPPVPAQAAPVRE